ncbi:unnamed protein product [Rotaria sp. Silwood1]|nr:unnamed protein product [Rotaria sp. Silwood1]
MGNRKSTRRTSLPPPAPPPIPPPRFTDIPITSTSTTIYPPMLPRRRQRNRLLPKIRAIFIPQAPSAGVCALPMAVAMPVTYPCANFGNMTPIEFLAFF